MSYFLGINIQDGCIGFVVTDTNYNILTKKVSYPGKDGIKVRNVPICGLHCFPQANSAAKRSEKRIARRATTRREFRKNFLRECVKEDIEKVDPLFFLRLDNYFFDVADKPAEIQDGIMLFNGTNGLTDKWYRRTYPSIFHLIRDVKNGTAPKDPRLYFLCLNYLMAHRGHNRLEVADDNINAITNFDSVWEQFTDDLMSYTMLELPASIGDSVAEVLLAKNLKKTEKKQKLDSIFADYAISASAAKKASAVSTMLSGGTVQLKDLFENDDYKGLKVVLDTINYEDPTTTCEEELGPDFDVIESAKAIYDWSLLKDVLKDYESITDAKIAAYERHKKYLKKFKTFIKKHDDDLGTVYNTIFCLSEPKLSNYVAYTHHVSKKEDIFYPCKYAAFMEFLVNPKTGILTQHLLNMSEKDKEYVEEIAEKMKENDFLLKPTGPHNSVIPNQLVGKEFKQILKNASEVMPSLNKKNEKGTTVAENLYRVFSFFIPYYVGPLTEDHKTSKNSWLIKKKDEPIRPDNYDEVIDLNATQVAYISNAIAQCTYVPSQKVLPKESMLYERFNVLNLLAAVSVNGSRLSPKTFRKAFNDLFVNGQKTVTETTLKNWFAKELGLPKTEVTITGLGAGGIPALKTYHKFESYLKAKKLTNEEVEDIIFNFTIIRKDNARKMEWVKNNLPQMSAKEAAELCKLKFNGWGKLSRYFLQDVATNDDTVTSVIDEMYKNAVTIGEIMGNKYSTKDNVSLTNYQYVRSHPETQSRDYQLDAHYIPSDKKREIVRSERIGDELVHVVKKVGGNMGELPSMIFIVVNGHVINPNANIMARKAQAEKAVDKIPALKDLAKSTPASRFNNPKVYLFFMQKGKCAYTNEDLDFEEMLNQSPSSHYYTIEHIYPDSKVGDSSIDNTVLVYKASNFVKRDQYPISKEIQDRMRPVWDQWKKEKLISETKYNRLISRDPLTDATIADMMSQSYNKPTRAGAVLGDLLKQKWKDQVPVKFIDVSKINEFRMLKDLPNYREISLDYHAVNAYIGIFLGNILHVMIDKSPIYFMDKDAKDGKVHLSNKLEKLLEHTRERNGEVAWDPLVHWPIVMNTINNIKVRRTYYAINKHSGINGGFYNTQIVKKGNIKGATVKNDPRLSLQKHGGYTTLTTYGFVLFKADTAPKKGSDTVERAVYMKGIPLLYVKKHGETREAMTKYCEDTFGAQNVEVLTDKPIKINSILIYDGLKVRPIGISSDRVDIRICDVPYMPDEIKRTLRSACRVVDKMAQRDIENRKNGVRDNPYKLEKWDKITAEGNRAAFKFCKSIYLDSVFRSAFMSPKYEEMFEFLESTWEDTSLEEQCVILRAFTKDLNPDDKDKVDFQKYKGPSSRGTLPTDLTGHTLALVNESPAGLFSEYKVILE